MKALLQKFFNPKLLPVMSLAGIGLLIFALCLNGPRPTCGLTKTLEKTVQMTSVDDGQEPTDDDTQSSQNTANTYEEIHDEIAILPHQIVKPYFSFFIPPADQLLDGLTLSKLQRPPRS